MPGLTGSLTLRGIGIVAGFALNTTLSAMTPSPGTADMCDSLDSVPITFAIGYQSGIQGIFNDNCVACHTNMADSPPPAGLSLDQGLSWSQIVNHASSQDPNLTRVVPNRPELSLLFHKVNCALPDVGSRMPYGGPPLSIEDQALIYDWIAAGAPFDATDTIFRGGFEIRG